MSQKPETVFRQNVVLPFLKSLKNTMAFPIQQVCIVGTPDFLLCSSGMFIGLELKAEKGSLSELQKYNLGQIEKCGGVAIVASPGNWDAVKDQLLKLDERGKYDQNNRG